MKIIFPNYSENKTLYKNSAQTLLLGKNNFSKEMGGGWELLFMKKYTPASCLNRHNFWS